MLLTFLLLLPFVGGFVILTIPYDKNNLYRKRIKIAGLITSIIIMIITLLLYIGYDSSFNHFQYVEDFNEIKLYDIYLGLDGASIYFVLLTSIIIPISLLSNYSSITKDIKLYIIIILLLELLLLTVFIVLDGLSYYIFFESILGPLFVLIGIYGSKGRVRACFYLFLYTLLGSLFLLLSILSMSSTTGYTDYDAIFKSNYDWLYQLFLFYGVFIAFAVKTPTIFLNTWLLKAHVESPLAGSIVLAAIVLKLSLYGVLRFILTLLAKAALHMTSIVYTIGVISIFYASYSTIRTIDVKELIAYSSVSHAVVYLMAVFSNTIQGIEGGILLGLAHGLTSSGLFICVGGILYDRTHTRVIYFYRGLAQIMPLFAILFFILSLGNSGVPLTLNFLGEFLSLYGIFERLPALGVFASSSIIFSAAYTIFMYNRISFAGSYSKYFQLYIPDLFKREYTILSTLVLFIIILGLYPSCILDGLHYDISKLLYGIDCIHYCVDDSNSDDLKDKPTAILDNMEIIEEKFTKCKINFLDTDENLKDNSTTEIYYDSDSDENMKDLKDLENMKDLKDLENMKDLKDLENEINLQDKKVEVLVELINSVFSFLLFLLYALLRIITGDKGDKGDKSQQGPENGPDREILLTINTSEIKPYNSGEIDSILNGKKYHVCMKKDDNAVEIENQAKVRDNNSNINTYEEQTSPATTSREINRNPNERDIYTSTTEFNTGQDEIAIDTTVTFPASNLENESLQDDLSQGELGDTEKFYSDDEDKMDETTKYDREFAKQLQYDLDRNLDRDVTDISIQEKLVQDKEIQKQVQTDAELAKNLAVMEEKGYKDNKSLAKRIQREEELETTAKSGATNKRRKIVSSASYAESSVNATARGTRINASNEETQPSQSTQRQEIPQTLSTQRQEIPQIQPTQRQEIPQVQSNQAMENKSPQSSLSGESSDKWAGPTDISDTSDDTIFSSDSRTDDPDSPYENYY